MTSANLTVTKLKSDFDNVVEQIVQTKQTKMKVRKSILMNNQSPTEKIKTYLGVND